MAVCSCTVTGTTFKVMSSIVLPGTPAVLLLASSGLPAQHGGVVSRVHRNGLAVEFSAAPPIQEGQRVAVVVGERGERMVASVVCRAFRSGVAVLQLASEWRPFHVREHERYEADLVVRLQCLSSRDAHDGTVTNLSAGGVAVRTAFDPDEREVRLSFGSDEFRTWVDCRLVATTDDEEREHLVHLAFRDLATAQRAVVRRVLAALKAQAEAELEEEQRRSRRVV